MTVLLVTVSFAIYIFTRCVYPLNISILAKIFSFLGILIMSESLVIGRLLPRIGIELSLTPIRILNFFFLIVVFFAAVLILRDIVLLLLYLFSKISGNNITLLNILASKKSLLIALFLSLAISGYGTYSALKVPSVKEITITIPNLPQNLKGLEIVQLTDLHIGSAFDHVWLEKVVAKTNGLNPDIIAVTGDMIDEYVSEVGDEVMALKDLKAKYGTYFIYGNHEYYENPLEWKEHFEGMGLNLLINQNVNLDINGSPLSIIGIGDPARGRQPDGMEPNNELALQGVPEDAIKILLCHQPKISKHNATFGYDLQLSGHTHGGQAILISSMIEGANDGYVSGLYQVGDMQLYVSNGTGLWGGGAFRLFVDSEITRITLQ